MKIYRIEHKDSRKGMWTHKIDDRLVLELISDKRLLDLPMPYDPTFNLHNYKWKTGVISKNALGDWFTFQDMADMNAHGFIIVELTVAKVNTIVQPNQILFIEKGILRKEDITEQFIL